MYSKQEASLLRQSFWTSFGQYMSLHTSAEGEKINWVNYKTGKKHIFFKMQADNKRASIAIEITHPLRELFMEQFRQLKDLLHNTLGEEWCWENNIQDENGKEISRIHQSLEGINIFKQEDWPAIISFLKPRIIALDDFWSNAKYAFDALDA